MKIRSVLISLGLFAGIVLSATFFSSETAVIRAAAAKPVMQYLGDVNNSGSVTAADARTILRAAVRMSTLPSEALPYADMDGSGELDAEDARRALRISIGLDEKKAHAFSCTVKKKADCQGAGTLSCVCTDCGAKRTVAVPKLKHRYSLSEKKAVTCVSDGKKVYRCDYCGKEKETVTPATGHKWKKATLKAPKTCVNCGKMITGWTTLNGHKYYFNKDGSMAKNRIVGSYYVGKDGVRAESKAIRLAVKFVNTYSSSSQTNYQRLTKCWYAAISLFKYKTMYGTPSASALPGCAISMFNTHYGNCYRYATAFAYIARVLGYDSAIEEGSINPGSYVSIHGWTKVKINGSWYIFDVVQQKYRPQYNFFKKTYRTYPLGLYRGTTYYLHVKNGIGSWNGKAE